MSEPDRSFALILSINAFETGSATPNIVDFGIIRGSSLKFATITHVRESGVTIFRPSCRSDGGEGCCASTPTRVITRAGSIPCMGMCAGSTHTSEGMLRPFSISSLAVATCRHLGATVIFSTAFTSHTCCCGVPVSEWGCSKCFPTGPSSSSCRFWGLWPILPLGNTVRLISPSVKSFPTVPNVILPVSKFSFAPVFFRKNPCPEVLLLLSEVGTPKMGA